MVKETLRTGQKPAKAQIKEIWAAEKRPITYTDDAPRLTSRELAEFKRVNAENRKKIPCTLRISKKSLEWWKSLGEGYTGRYGADAGRCPKPSGYSAKNYLT